MTFLTGLGLFIAGAIVGTTLGALVMAAFNARGPCAQDALWHLGRLHRLLDEAGEIPLEGGAMDNARRYLARWGDGEGV